MQITAYGEQTISSLIDFKMRALFNDDLTIHHHRYSHEIHGYIFQIGKTMHIVLNSEKSKEEMFQTKQELIYLAFKHYNKIAIFLHGEERNVTTAPYDDGKMEINIFEFANLVENIHQRGVQNHDS